jgi:hypothetical protein
MRQKRKYHLCTSAVATKSEAALASKMQLLTQVTYIELQVMWYQASGIFMKLTKITKKIYNFYKVISRTNCRTHMFTHYLVVLPATSGSTACHFS